MNFRVKTNHLGSFLVYKGHSNLLNTLNSCNEQALKHYPGFVGMIAYQSPKEWLRACLNCLVLLGFTKKLGFNDDLIEIWYTSLSCG